ncbi:hypothetical protein [Leucobacter celer]|uniref:hypothetical protein n=1 Tax=Leucobacter celer TaxID=668625 RepID=UPI0006A78263|nr:hypothetical protein [Leucobacter celer]
MLHRYLERARRGSSTTRRAASGALALLLAFGALFGIAAPALAAPPAAPTMIITVPASGELVDFGESLEAGSEITAVSASGGVQAQLTSPTSIAFSSTASATYPSYSFTVDLPYTVSRDGETADGLIHLTVVQKPWVFRTGPSPLVVAPGETVQSTVTAMGAGFISGVATDGGYAVGVSGPAWGAAGVTSAGVVSYTAPVDAIPNSTTTFKVTATDIYGQVGETFEPFTVTIKGTAEADTFGVDIPFETDPAGTRVEILPDHARGENARVTNVIANVNNAAVDFDETGVTFTPSPRIWESEQNGYSFAAPYTVTDDNGTANAQINVRVLRPPLLSVDDALVSVPIGGSASTTVWAMNHPVIPATDGYRIDQSPITGTATVDDQGVVTYEAPAEAEPGDSETVRVEVTDKVGQSRAIDVEFVAYVGAHAPGVDGERADAPFELNLLDGAGGDGKRLSDVALVSGDATVNADLATGAVEVAPNHVWAEGETSHEIELAYTIEDVEGRTDTGTATFRVLAKPGFAEVGEGESRKRAEVGDVVEFSAAVFAPENLPETGAYAVTKQPELIAVVEANRTSSGLPAAAPGGVPVTVSDSGVVTVDTAGLFAGGEYELAVRVEDRVGQSVERTFELSLSAGSEPPSGGPQGSANGGAHGGADGASDPREAPLVRTGADPLGVLGFAVALIAAAAGVLVLRRRAG